MEPEIWQKVWPYRLPILFFGIGLILLLISAVLFYKERTGGQSVVIEQSETQTATPSAMIKVDVEGAVEKPGVYGLPINSRIKDGLVAAGGLSVAADREYVSKNINLAQKLIDGVKIYIPTQNEVSLAPRSPQGGVGSSSLSSSNLININLSQASDLDKLVGIGQITAQKIIDGRPYQSIDELLSKKILGKSVFDKIKDQITVY